VDSEEGRCNLQASATIDSERTHAVGLILLVLLLVLIFAGAGFALHVLWIIAVVLLLIWLLGFLVSGAEHSWYRVQKK
jgi:energy-coupling factor transporter transmembrane protein EcfT